MRWGSTSSRRKRCRRSACGRHFVPVGEAALELLEPTSPDSAIAKFIEKRGPGVHHVTLRVDDIEGRSRG